METSGPSRSMKNAHIAFISYSQFPNIGPTLPIVSVLVRRGHRVTYATSDVFASRIAATGAEVVPLPRVPPPSDLDAGYAHTVTQHALDSIEAITPFYERHRPALIVYDYIALAGRVLAKKWNIPAIQTSPTFLHDRKAHSKQLLDPDFRELALQYSRTLDTFLERFGIVGEEFLFYREKLNIYLFPKPLQPCAESEDDSCLFSGRCAGEQPWYGTWQKSSTDGRRLALVSTSTLYVQGPEHFRMCIEALSGPEWHLLLSVGEGDPARLGPLPPHCEIVQHTSHVKILPHVSVFICLGGIVTQSEAAYHGVPLILTTHGFPELEWIAESAVRLGVGIHLRKADMSPESLRRAATQICADPAVGTRLKKLQSMVRHEPGAEETANRIEEYLEACG